MTVHLLDANVAIALVVAEHEHHARTLAWAAQAGELAVCPVVQGALMRFLVRMGEHGTAAAAVVEAMGRHPRVTFWPDDLPYDLADWTGVVGHRQVTDAYLAGLARHHGGRLATLDEALATLRPDDVTLLP